jgi:hypothetical protein
MCEVIEGLFLGLLWIICGKIPEDAYSLFLRNVVIYPQVHAVLLPRGPTQTICITIDLSFSADIYRAIESQN